MNTKTDSTSSDAASTKPILAALAKRVPKAKQAEAKVFADAFYRRMSQDEFAQHGADGWAALGADILEFARARKRGRRRRLDRHWSPAGSSRSKPPPPSARVSYCGHRAAHYSAGNRGPTAPALETRAPCGAVSH